MRTLPDWFITMPKHPNALSESGPGLRHYGDSAAFRRDLDAVTAERRRLHEAAGKAALTDEAQARWDALDAEEVALRASIAASEEAEARLQRVSESRARWNDVTIGLAAQPADPAYQARSEAMRHVDALHRNGHIHSAAAERCEALVSAGTPVERSLAGRWMLTAGDPAYRSAFGKLLADSERGHMLWSATEQRAFAAVTELRAAMSTTGANGGYMVPLTLDPAVMLTGAGSNNPLRRLSRVVTTTTDAWSGISSAGATAEWKAQGSEAADGSPTVANPSIQCHLADVFVPFSIELALATEGTGFQDEIQKVMFDAADQLLATAYTTGTGEGQPKGLITALAGTASEINTTGTEAIDASDPFALQNALPARFSANAQFMANIAIINGYRQMETTAGSWEFPELRNNPPSLLGRPVWENSNMDGTITPAATGNNYVAVYGDFQQFVIVDRIGSTIEFIPNLVGENGRPTGQRGFVLYLMTGSDCPVINGFRMLDVPTTA